MESEVERTDCREMVRDITHAVLPGRPGSAAVRLGLGANEAYLNVPDASRQTSGAYLHSSAAAGKASSTGLRLSAANVAEEQARRGVEAAERATHTARIAEAIDTGDGQLATLLLKQRADPNQLLESRQSPLCAAVQRGHLSLVSALLAHGANTHMLDLLGDTPLHHAARGGNPELVKLLLGAGAIATVTDASGRMPHDLAADDAVHAMLLHSRSGVEQGVGAREHGIPSCSTIAGTMASLEESEESGDEANDTEMERVRPAPRPLFDSLEDPQQWPEPDENHAAPPKDTAQPSVPSMLYGEPASSVEQLSASQLVADLQRLLHSQETEPKRLLTLPKGVGSDEVQCDVMRSSISPMVYRCFLRLGGVSSRRICIFEAVRSRKGKLKSSHYAINLFNDPRLMLGTGGDGYCGKMRSKSLSGANFVCYDGGHKSGEQIKQGSQRAATGQPRRQMAAVVFNKASSRRAPMSMRVLTPSVELAGTAGTVGLELLDTLQALGPDGCELPGGTELLRLVPPRWNEQGQMFQLSYEGRACCMSNKNVQLANVANESSPTLQVGKLQKNLFNMDLGGCISPFQAFAISLSIFEQSSVRRRF